MEDRLYTIWRNIKQRCTNPNHPDYKYYGARKIERHTTWDDYQVFHDWAHANGYAEHLTIERKDNTKGYEPGNCTWATRGQQAANRKNARNGKRMSKYTGVSASGDNNWMVKISTNGVCKYLGSYDTEEEAARIWDAFIIKHGLKRPTNF